MVPSDPAYRPSFLLSDLAGSECGDEIAQIERIVETALPRLGRTEDDSRPFPDGLLRELAPDLLPIMARAIERRTETAFSGTHVLRLLPLWLGAVASAGHAACLLMPPPPVKRLTENGPPTHGYYCDLVDWLARLSDAVRCRNLFPATEIVAGAEAADAAEHRFASLPLLNNLASSFLRQVSGDRTLDSDKLREHLRVQSQLTALLPIVSKGPIDRDLVFDLLQDMKTGLMARCFASGWMEGMVYAASLGEWQEALQRSAHARMLRKVLLDPRNIFKRYLSYHLLSYLVKHGFFFSERRKKKLKRSMAKRDPALLAKRWTMTRSAQPDLFGIPSLSGVEAVASDITRSPSSEPRLAVVIHAFYLDGLAEILDWISLSRERVDGVFITCPASLETDVGLVVEAAGMTARIKVVENRGRDVRPLFAILPDVAASGAEVVLKLHTKKSPHRRDGAIWKRQSLVALASPWAIRSVLGQFQHSERLGIVGAPAQIFRISDLVGDNKKHLVSLARALNVPYGRVIKDIFIAGTMFFARTEVLVDTAGRIDDSRFEDEAGQLDATYAHAIERIFVAIAHAGGWRAQNTIGQDLTAVAANVPDGDDLDDL